MKTILRTYRLDLSNPVDAVAYQELREKLIASGVQCHATTPAYTTESSAYWAKLEKLNGQEIELQTDFITDDQWNTAPVQGISESGFRVFDWCEPICENRCYKYGHYLEQTEEMATIRREMLKCGYCGKMYHTSEGKEFCTGCLGSSYLKVTNLKLLRLRPAGEFNPERPELTEAETNVIMPLYLDAQIHGATAADIERIAKARASLQNELTASIKKAQTKYDGMIWLMDHGIDTDNVLYYDYNNTFGFGWRSPIESAVLDALRAELEGFPFNYQIVTETGTTHKK